MRKLGIITLLAAALAAAGASAGERVALSFDDGPEERQTPRLLDVLKSAGVKATFCLVGRRVERWPDIVRRIHAEGHELCNHSWDHPILTSSNVVSQIEKTDAAIEAVTGTKPRILRAPGGEIRHVGPCYKGRPFVGWGKFGDTRDWKHRSPGNIIRIASKARSGEIVLMHDLYSTTVSAVPDIIKQLNARGVSFAYTSELWENSCSAVARQ